MQQHIPVTASKRRVYLASSWRNTFHSEVYAALVQAGHSVYNFKHKADVETCDPRIPQPTAFAWSELDPEWKSWTPRRYRELLSHHPRAAQGYVADHRAMEWADTCVLLLPCGRSAHIEAGYMKGRGKHLIILFPQENTPDFEPDLMYLGADCICIGVEEAIGALANEF